MAIDTASSTTAAASLAPGFRFHPTDEELVRYYLRRKICGQPFRFDAISEIDIYKAEPWDLPGKSRLKTRDLEWYFFSFLDKKYGNGSRTNRATDRGYWKTTGKDRTVYHKSEVVGMKKTLVYHCGRAPKGERTNWVMHEYRLTDKELEKAGLVQDSFVLCRIFRKSGSGPKNGEQYGAPFIEEEWEEDEFVTLPKEESAVEAPVGNDGYLDENDLEQILGAGIPLESIPSGNAPLPLNFSYGDSSSNVEDSTENSHGAGQPDGEELYSLPVQYDMDTKLIKHEYAGQSSNDVNPADVDFLLDEPFVDASENLPYDDGAFLETNDLQNPVEADPSSFNMLEEYLTYFDATDFNSDYMAFDSSKMMGSEDIASDPASLIHEYVPEGQMTMPHQKLVGGNNNDVASSSNQESAKFGTAMQFPFVKQANRMLGNIPAPPAYASEFPSKDAMLQLNSASQSSSAVHVTAGVIQIRNMSLTDGGVDWSFGKHGCLNIVLSFGLSRGLRDSKVE
ncbi:hypothetical protein RJ640_021096, partial [Escallonia rubra]